MEMIIDIKQVGELLGYKDARSVRRVLRKMGIHVFKVEGTKRYFVHRINLYFALQRNLRNEAGKSIDEIQSRMKVLSTHFVERKALQHGKQELVNIDEFSDGATLDTEMTLPIPNNFESPYQGVVIHCLRCKRDIKDMCKGNQKPIGLCQYKDRHILKQYIHMPGTRNQRKTFTIQSRTRDEIIIEAIGNRKKVFNQVENDLSQLQGTNDGLEKFGEEKTSLRLQDAINLYLRHLSGERVSEYSFDTHARSKEHVSSVKLGLKYLSDHIKDENIKVDAVDRKMVKGFYDSLKDRGFSERTVQMHVSTAASLCEFLNKEGYPNPNYFKAVPKKALGGKEIRTITEKQFNAILDKMDNTEAGQKRGEEMKWLWRPWLKDAAKLALFSGRRTHEIFELTSDSIIRNESGKLLYLSSFDRKVNLIKNLTGDQRRQVFIPASPELESLIDELMHKNRKFLKESGQKHCYLIAPYERSSRETMTRQYIRSFNFYAGLAYPIEGITAGILRKTHISRLSAVLGLENARSITRHSSFRVMEQHYLNPKVMLEMRNFSIFGSPDSIVKERELREVRNNSRDQTLER